MPSGIFDRIVADGTAAILSGRVSVEVPPGEGGRWGLSVVFRPTARLAGELDVLTSEVITVAGFEHWRTGSHGAAHVTIRALEPHRASAVDPVVLKRYTAAIRRSVTDLGSVPFEFTGFAVSAGTVMVCAHNHDGVGDELRLRLGDELGDDGWLENGSFTNGRDPIWYATLINFTGPIVNPIALVDWITSRRTSRIGEVAFSQIDLCRWTFDGTRMAPEVLSSVDLAANGIV